MFLKTKNYKNEDGEVETKPRNIQTTGGKKGAIDASLFSKPSYVFQNGEKYTDGGKFMMRDSKPITVPAEHDRAFKPCRHVRMSSNAAFEHMQDINHVKKNCKNEDGEVITEPRNFVTAPPKKGNCALKGATFGGMAEHVPDDYNYPKKLARKELDYHMSKLQEVAFKNRVTPLPYFNKHKEIYDIKDHIKARPPPPKKQNHVEAGIHDKHFFPSTIPKTGCYDKSIGKFPEYLPNPLK